MAAGTIRLSQIILHEQSVYWIEGRPVEGGRHVIVRCSGAGEQTDLIDAPFSARSRVHEYGAGSMVVSRKSICFSHDTDQRLYRFEPGGQPFPITPAPTPDGGERRFADGMMDRHRHRMICVCEEHSPAHPKPVNTLVTIDLKGSHAIQDLVRGNDFYASPRLNPKGTHLAWLSWNFPLMPWDGTTLWLGEIYPDGSVEPVACVAGGSEESIFQPSWSPQGDLFFVSDRTGWWNLYCYRDGQVQTLTELEAEFGRPQWQFGESTYGFESNDSVICSYAVEGIWRLARLDLPSGRLDSIETPYTSISGLQVDSGKAVFIGSSPSEPESIISLDLASGQTEVLRRSHETDFDKAYISIPEAIRYQVEEQEQAHGFYYPPVNPDYLGPKSKLPPLLVFCHGGPTNATDNGLDLVIQFWTSRGIAVLDVNYRGSSGYGRAYRQRLSGLWGVVDVEDCVRGALHLAAAGRVDRERLIIRGCSAGGYTTLAALTFRDEFKAGASYYGVSDLEALAKETHKFESRYLDQLIGPYPDRRDLYRERSPIHHINRLECPVIFFQGSEDKVVPPNQAELMVNRLRKNGLPVAYLLFKQEHHGFRKAENIKRAMEAEFYFYSRVFGFTPADPIDPIEIENV